MLKPPAMKVAGMLRAMQPYISESKYAYGSYTGDGAVERIINTGFEPDIVIIHSGDVGYFKAERSKDMGGTLVYYHDPNTGEFEFQMFTPPPQGLQLIEFRSDGFAINQQVIGSIFNEPGVDYTYSAIKLPGGG